MDTRIDEIADRVYRLSTFVAAVGPPQGFTFNQFLIDAEEPLLFHCGQRFALSIGVRGGGPDSRSRAAALDHVQPRRGGRVRLGEHWLAAAPRATAAHGRVGCAIWLTDAADRPPRALADGEWLDLGGKTVQRIDTPHVPHSWDAGLLYEKTTGTLFCSDLFTHLGDPPALTDGDIVGPAIAAEERFHFTSLTPEHGRHDAPPGRARAESGSRSCTARPTPATRAGARGARRLLRRTAEAGDGVKVRAGGRRRRRSADRRRPPLAQPQDRRGERGEGDEGQRELRSSKAQPPVPVTTTPHVSDEHTITT